MDYKHAAQQVLDAIGGASNRRASASLFSRCAQRNSAQSEPVGEKAPFWRP